MYKSSVILLLVSFVALFLSCGDCDCCLVDCISPVGFDIEVKDKVTSESLLNTPDSLYVTSSMEMNSVINGELVRGSLFSVADTGITSTIFCFSNVPPDEIIITLNEEDSDTLQFISNYIEGDCCNAYKLETVSINGGNAIPVLNNTVTLLK